MDNNNTDPRSIGRKIYDWLIAIGVPAIIAAALVAAVYGLLVYAGIISLSSCTLSYTKLPDGTTQAVGTVVLPQKVETTVTK